MDASNIQICAWWMINIFWKNICLQSIMSDSTFSGKTTNLNGTNISTFIKENEYLKIWGSLIKWSESITAGE